MLDFRLPGLTAATLTPFQTNGKLHLDIVPEMVSRLSQSGVRGLFVCGSTGEGVSLTDAERRAVSEAHVNAAQGLMPVVVHVGHDSLESARGLAVHAASVGADAIASTAPSYFKAEGLQSLVDSMAYVASAAPTIPFYYYHVPALTGAHFDMLDFLKRASEVIPNLIGLKFTAPALDQYQACLEFERRRFDVLWGHDEMMLGALAVGGAGAVGSTFNVAAPVYLRLISAFEAGDLNEARLWQSRAIQFIRVLAEYPFHSALRVAMRLAGMNLGNCRLPKRSLTNLELSTLEGKLQTLGFLEWCGITPAPEYRFDGVSHLGPTIKSPRTTTANLEKQN